MSSEIQRCIRADPERARDLLRAAYRYAGASRKGTAASIGVSVCTIWRWVVALGLGDEFRRTRTRAMAEGWAARDGRGSGRRGPDRRRRARRTTRESGSPIKPGFDRAN